MTLSDFVAQIDWSFIEDDLEKWMSRLKNPEELPDEQKYRSREALLDASLHLLICNSCAWVGFREESCPNCKKPTKEHWEGRFWARKVLDKAWSQAVDILEHKGLVASGT